MIELRPPLPPKKDIDGLIEAVQEPLGLSPGRTYARGLGEFLAWCEDRGMTSLAAIQPVHVAAYVEHLTRTKSAPTA